MGFYIRKGFSFGPLRLNLSRSGLGASFGVKGARIGIGPRGSYIHMGRGGLYYRQTLNFPEQTPEPTHPSAPQQPISIDSLREISSASAAGMVDSSAIQLLQELNRVNRRTDLFPIILLIGSFLSVRLLFLSFQSWLYAFGILAAVGVAVLARNSDVTNGTVILNYSFEDDSGLNFRDFQNAFARLAGCYQVWHVEATGPTADWKRNAGASYLVQRTNIRPIRSRPPKVECNIDVPTLTIDRKSLYFFPDRLLVYDPSGVGAVSYSELNAQTGQTRFIEEGSVPSDAQQVGTTWRYVARNGGPDRRFNNNRQLPILLYGQMSLTSASGLNDLFQYSVPDGGSAFAVAIEKLRAANPAAAYNANENGDRSSENARATRALLWASLGLMTVLLFLLSWPLLNLNTGDAQTAQEEKLAKDDQARRGFVDGLNQRFLGKNISATAASVNTGLTIQFTREGPKAAQRDGIEPFTRNIFFNRFLLPSDERTLCDLGFRTLSIARNGAGPKTFSLTCLESRIPQQTKVHITSSPNGSEIYIDGKFAGNTPSDVTLGVGKHVVRVMTDGREWSRAIEITSHREISLYADILNSAAGSIAKFPAGEAKGKAESGNSTQKADSIAKSQSSARPETISVAATEGLATISVTSDPAGAEIYVDDSFKGKAPVILDLKSGQHSIRAFAKDYHNWSQWITIVAGAHVNITAKMERSN